MLLITDEVLHPIRWNPPNRANTHRPRHVRGLPQSGGTLSAAQARRHASAMTDDRNTRRSQHPSAARAPVPPTPPSTMPGTEPPTNTFCPSFKLAPTNFNTDLSRTSKPKSRHKTNTFCPITLNAKGSIISAGGCARYAEGPTFRSTPQRIPSTQCSCSQMTPLECFVGMCRTRVARAVFPCDDTYCRG